MKIASVVLLSTLVFTGCKPKAKAGDATGSAATTGGAGDEDAPSEVDQLSTKEGAYVDCLNSFTGDVFHGRQIYRDTFPDGPSAAMAGKESLYGPLELHDLKECKDGVAAAKGEKPALPDLEKAGDAYVASIETLLPLTKELHAYFDMGNYKDDKLAKAIELHPKLMAAYDAFVTANDALEKQVDSLEDKINLDRLAAIEKAEGKKQHYLHLKYLIEAKKVVNITSEVESLATVPLEPLTAAVTALDAALTEDSAYYDAHKAEVDKDGMAYWSFINPAKDLVKDAKDLMRRARDKDNYSNGEKMTIEANNAEAVPGHPARVSKSYNSVVDTSNRLRW